MFTPARQGVACQDCPSRVAQNVTGGMNGMWLTFAVDSNGLELRSYVATDGSEMWRPRSQRCREVLGADGITRAW